MFVGVIWLIVKCFEVHAGWGVCSILFPGITWLAFLILHPDKCWKPTATYIAGIFCIFLPFIIYAVKPDLIVTEAKIINQISQDDDKPKQEVVKLRPYKVKNSDIKPTTIKKVPIRDGAKVKYYDVTFHDYFLEDGDKLFAVELDNETGVLPAKKIDKDLCDASTISKIRSFASLCMKSKQN